MTLPMKHKLGLVGAALAVIALLLTGCIAISVYPFYSDKDVLFDSALLGQWTNTTNLKEHWIFEKQGQQAYHLSYAESDKTCAMDAHLFHLNDQLFLDLFTTKIPDDIMPPPIPTHLVMRVFQVKPTLRMAVMDYDWLTKLVEHNPGAIRHHVIVTGEDGKNSQIVLTADTAELQSFILKHLKTEEAWKDSFELRRN